MKEFPDNQVFENVDEKTKKELFDNSVSDPFNESANILTILEKYPELLRSYCVSSLGLVLDTMINVLKEHLGKPLSEENDDSLKALVSHVIRRLIYFTNPILGIDIRYSEIHEIIKTISVFAETRNSDKPDFNLILERLEGVRTELGVKSSDRADFFEIIKIGKEKYIMESVKEALKRLSRYFSTDKKFQYEVEDFLTIGAFISKNDEAYGIPNDIKSLIEVDHPFDEFVGIAKRIVEFGKNKPNLANVHNIERFYFIQNILADYQN